MIIRKLDELGRIVIPKEMRKELELEQNTPVEIELNGRELIVRKHAQKCTFCGKDATETFKNKRICKKCLEEIKENV